MALRREFVRLLAHRTTEELIEKEMIEVPEGFDLKESVYQVMQDEIAIESRLNEEVRSILNQYSEQLRQTGASYQEMFKLVKSKLVPREETRSVSMRLSHEKVNLLSHRIVEKLVSMDEIEFIEDRNTIRLGVLATLNAWLRKEDEIDREARRKIESHRRSIPEGSEEWEILYRKYYDEEMRILV